MAVQDAEVWKSSAYWDRVVGKSPEGMETHGLQGMDHQVWRKTEGREEVTYHYAH